MRQTAIILGLLIGLSANAVYAQLGNSQNIIDVALGLTNIAATAPTIKIDGRERQNYDALLRHHQAHIVAAQGDVLFDIRYLNDEQANALFDALSRFDAIQTVRLHPWISYQYTTLSQQSIGRFHRIIQPEFIAFEAGSSKLIPEYAAANIKAVNVAWLDSSVTESTAKEGFAALSKIVPRDGRLLIAPYPAIASAAVDYAGLQLNGIHSIEVLYRQAGVEPASFAKFLESLPKIVSSRGVEHLSLSGRRVHIHDYAINPHRYIDREGGGESLLITPTLAYGIAGALPVVVRNGTLETPLHADWDVAAANIFITALYNRAIVGSSIEYRGSIGLFANATNQVQARHVLSQLSVRSRLSIQTSEQLAYFRSVSPVNAHVWTHKANITAELDEMMKAGQFTAFRSPVGALPAEQIVDYPLKPGFTAVQANDGIWAGQLDVAVREATLTAVHFPEIETKQPSEQ